MKPEDIAKLITEDINETNGLMEELGRQYPDRKPLLDKELDNANKAMTLMVDNIIKRGEKPDPKTIFKNILSGTKFPFTNEERLALLDKISEYINLTIKFYQENPKELKEQ